MNYCANICMLDMNCVGRKDGCIVSTIEKPTHACMHNDVHEQIVSAAHMTCFWVWCAHGCQTVLNDVLWAFQRLDGWIAEWLPRMILWMHMNSVAAVFPRRRGRTTESRLAGTFMISSVSNVSKCSKRLNTNEKSWHDGHGKKGVRIVVSCPLKTLKYQR